MAQKNHDFWVNIIDKLTQSLVATYCSYMQLLLWLWLILRKNWTRKCSLGWCLLFLNDPSLIHAVQPWMMMIFLSILRSHGQLNSSDCSSGEYLGLVRYFVQTLLAHTMVFAVIEHQKIDFYSLMFNMIMYFWLNPASTIFLFNLKETSFLFFESIIRNCLLYNVRGNNIWFFLYRSRPLFKSN